MIEGSEGEADARGEDVLLRGAEVRDDVLVGHIKAALTGGVEPGEVVLLLVGDGGEIVAQAEVEGEFWSYLPVVGGVGSEASEV